MKPVVCGDELDIYVPSEGCTDCDLALSRIDNLMADDIGVDPKSLSFYDGSTAYVHNIQENLDELKYQIDNAQAGIIDLDTLKQNELVSGTNIKTINGISLLGSGNITIGGGGGSITIDSALDTESTNAVENGVIATAINAKQDALSAGSGISISSNTVSTPLAGYHCSKASTTTSTASGVNKVIPLSLHKGSGSIFSISSGNLVCNVDGVYEVSAQATWTPDSSGTTSSVDLTLDVGGNSVSSRTVSPSGVSVTACLSPIPFALESGDVISLQVTATGVSGGVAGGFRYTRVMIRRLA